ncbi:MAG: thioredoxin domain-containing protein [Gemmatimonadota bacterium]
MPISSVLSVFSVLSALSACRPQPPSADQLKAMLVAHPDILFEVIKQHPAEFFQVVQRAASEYQKTAGAASQRDSLRMEQDLASPKRPAIGPGRAMQGNPSAPIVIVEYSDFQCPYCKRANGVNQALFSKYGSRLLLVLKQAPLEMHPQAMISAQYFEAVLRQDSAKAWRFHDLLFDDQARLGKEGQAFLDVAARQVGADLARVHKDAESPGVKAVIAADLAEFQSYEFGGTPGFVVNGVRLDGSYPLEVMSGVIERTLKK